MIRFVMTVALLIPALCPAQSYSTYIADASLYRQRESLDGLYVARELDDSPLAASEFAIQHTLRVEESTRFRINLYVGVIWSFVWGDARPHAPAVPILYAYSQRSAQ